MYIQENNFIMCTLWVEVLLSFIENMYRYGNVLYYNKLWGYSVKLTEIV